VSGASASRIIFITGTDTGVGKTLLTGLLLYHLRRRGCDALATKPFASGGRADAEFLCSLQRGDLTIDEVNPFHFAQPLAPLVASRKQRRPVRLREVFRHVRRLAARCECLLVEGVGGLLVPLGESYSVLDIMAGLGCEVVLVAPNRLGTINHTLLTVAAMQSAGIKRVRTVLMGAEKSDLSSRSNALMLRELLVPVPLFSIPFLGQDAGCLEALGGIEKKFKKSLAEIVA
jgi:dethiobiotin synthetase